MIKISRMQGEYKVEDKKSESAGVENSKEDESDEVRS